MTGIRNRHRRSAHCRPGFTGALPVCLTLALAAATATPSIAAASPSIAQASPERARADANLGDLRVGKTVYRNARVINQTPEALILHHAGGLAKVYFRDVPPALQERFGYDPEEARAYRRQAARSTTKSEPELEPGLGPPTSAAPPAGGSGAQTDAEPAPPQGSEQVTAFLSELGKTPEIRDRVDFRETARELLPSDFEATLVKSQGWRPSCAVFAVVAALELQHARRIGGYERLSEAYLLWATEAVIQRRRDSTPSAVPSAVPSVEAGERVDRGYRIRDVIEALQVFGIAPEDRMRYGLGADAEEAPPSPALIDLARGYLARDAHRIAGERERQLEAVVLALNHGLPVVVGLRWPQARAIRNGVLSNQAPVEGYLHAVTLYGYTAEAGDPDSIRFLFRNSYGVRWGVNGYGWMTRDYLLESFVEAVIVDVPAVNR